MTKQQRALENSIEHEGEVWFRIEDFCALIGIDRRTIYNTKHYRTTTFPPSRRIWVSWTHYTARMKIKGPKPAGKARKVVQIVPRRKTVNSKSVLEVIEQQRQRFHADI